MRAVNQFLVIVVYFLVSCTVISADKPCAARKIKGRSVVCVCNETYCDELTCVAPRKGQYLSYTSSAAGSRFKKSQGNFQSCLANDNGDYFVHINASKKYQKIKGYGGAVTDSAAMNWKSFSEAMQQKLVDAYYGEIGLKYTFARVPMGGSDFSVRYYTYQDNPDEPFSLQEEDLEYKIPLLKKIMERATDKIDVLGGVWTSPDWMKYFTETNQKCGFLQRKYYQAFVDYMLKFVESYENSGIPIWGISTGNEPSLATYPYSPIRCLGWGTYEMGDWIVNYLGPTVRNGKHHNLQLLALDDQRYTIKIIFDRLVLNNSKVLSYVDGLAVHYYADGYVSPEIMAHATKQYPGKYVISTEACAGFRVNGVKLGAWSNAKKYVKDIMQDFKHGVVSWVDWNLYLDKVGGPNVDSNFVDAPIIVDCEKKEFLKQPMYYALGHLSKFIPKGSYRIESWSPRCHCSISNVAFLTPSNTIVVVIYNSDAATSVTIKHGSRKATIQVEAESIVTAEFLNEF